jgi:hypothetical protein
MPLTDPAMVLALSVLISGIITGLGSWYVLRNAAKKDSLQLANTQIEAQARTIASQSEDISTLRKEYGDLWKQSRKDRDDWALERDMLKAAICDLQEENRLLKAKIDKGGS